MKKSSTSLFVLFVILILFFLIGINFFKNSVFFSALNDSVIPLISLALVFLIILSFILREIENNKIQSRFMAIVTHKFKTPLVGIRWATEMLQKDLTLIEKGNLLNEMHKANDRLMEIVDLLIGFAKFDKHVEYVFQEVSLLEIIENSYNKYSVAIQNKGINFSILSAKELAPVIIDKNKIQFVVDMLVDNAIKYTPKKGSITVSFEESDKALALKIKDTGIGLNFLDSHRLFGHFFRAQNAKLMDAEGLGLGLYTAKKIVSHHKGKLWAESAGINKGSTFFLRLPIKK